MDKPHLFVGAWFGTCLTSFIFAIFFLVYISSARLVSYPTTSYRLYSALPQNISQTNDFIGTKDARSKIVEDFFKGYNSKLSQYGNQFVAVADNYNLDFRLLPAIAMQESNGGKIIPNNSFNPFGFGIYGGGVIR